MAGDLARRIVFKALGGLRGGEVVLRHPDGRGGGVIEGTVPRSEVDWYAAQLLSVGPDIVVESPPELVAAIRAQADAIAALYRR